MSATEHGTGGIPSDAPVITKEWAPGVGETITKEWPLGTPSNVNEAYENEKALAIAGNNLQSLSMRTSNGRSSLVARFGRSGNSSEYGEDVAVVEELYSIDIIKDICESPYWKSMSNDDMSWVRHCVENRLTEDEITIEAAVAPGRRAWASWSALMKSLRYHMIHGVDTYYETGFILRRSLHGVRTSVIRASFSGINAVGADPSFKSQMHTLIESLPSGEWLYRPPQAEHLGRGRWRITQEWQWAVKWSVMYGGTWDIPS